MGFRILFLRLQLLWRSELYSFDLDVNDSSGMQMISSISSDVDRAQSASTSQMPPPLKIPQPPQNKLPVHETKADCKSNKTITAKIRHQQMLHEPNILNLWEN